MKWCGKCKEWKEESEFYKDKRRRDELTYSCKECQKRRSPNYNKKATSIDNNQKRCSKCKEIKDKIEFQNASDQKSGLSCQCRLCKSKNYQKNKEKITKQVHAYKKRKNEKRSFIQT